MAKAAKSKSKTKGGYYAVAVGFRPGIYRTWPEAQKQTDGYSCPKQEKFPTLQQAEAYMTKHGAALYIASTSARTSSEHSTHTNSSGAPLRQFKKGKKRSSPFDDVPVDEEHLWEVVYTDGACSNNGKAAHLALAGVGVWFGHGDPRNISERCPGDQTNNRAELIAIIRALEQIPPGSKPLLIKTDSSYSIDSVYNWVPNFLAKSQRLLDALEEKGERPTPAARVWKTSDGKDVKNQALLHYLVTLLQYRKRVLKQEWRLQYVKGHNGEEGNEGADGLAVGGARMGWVEEDDWDAKREGLQDQIDGTFLAWGDREKERAKEVGLEDTDNLPSDAEVNADSDADEWDFDEDMLDAIDPPSPVKKEPPSQLLALDEDEDEDEDPFADLTEEQLAQLESPARPSGST
ncbi:ribonuclease H-like protein [Exidia glandulosa HHB12029]|uniref:Ribonuclease H n=1 Tax=Exidia glandulosa HHB12029 TaxID=1314781 RepID=A0A165DFS0_EXIGL|nr:ribonuclease H-like protein [Exidia glandulosa HHB12029]